MRGKDLDIHWVNMFLCDQALSNKKNSSSSLQVSPSNAQQKGSFWTKGAHDCGTKRECGKNWNIYCYWTLPFQSTNVALWLGAFVVAWECVFGISHLRRDNKLNFAPWSTFEACVYEMLTRLAWSVAMGWVTIACVKGWGGLINTFLSWGVFQTVAKISYMTYLLHLTVMNVLWNNSRTYETEPSYFYQVQVQWLYKNQVLIILPLVDVFLCWCDWSHIFHFCGLRLALWISLYASTKTFSRRYAKKAMIQES